MLNMQGCSATAEPKESPVVIDKSSRHKSEFAALIFYYIKVYNQKGTASIITMNNDTATEKPAPAPAPSVRVGGFHKSIYFLNKQYEDKLHVKVRPDASIDDLVYANNVAKDFTLGESGVSLSQLNDKVTFINSDVAHVNNLVSTCVDDVACLSVDNRKITEQTIPRIRQDIDELAVEIVQLSAKMNLEIKDRSGKVILEIKGEHEKELAKVLGEVEEKISCVKEDLTSCITDKVVKLTNSLGNDFSLVYNRFLGLEKSLKLVKEQVEKNFDEKLQGTVVGEMLEDNRENKNNIQSLVQSLYAKEILLGNLQDSLEDHKEEIQGLVLSSTSQKEKMVHMEKDVLKVCEDSLNGKQEISNLKAELELLKNSGGMSPSFFVHIEKMTSDLSSLQQRFDLGSADNSYLRAELNSVNTRLAKMEMEPSFSTILDRMEKLEEKLEKKDLELVESNRLYATLEGKIALLEQDGTSWKAEVQGSLQEQMLSLQEKFRGIYEHVDSCITKWSLETVEAKLHGDHVRLKALFEQLVEDVANLEKDSEQVSVAFKHIEHLLEKQKDLDTRCNNFDARVSLSENQREAMNNESVEKLQDVKENMDNFTEKLTTIRAAIDEIKTDMEKVHGHVPAIVEEKVSGVVTFVKDLVKTEIGKMDTLCKVRTDGTASETMERINEVRSSELENSISLADVKDQIETVFAQLKQLKEFNENVIIDW
jgi:chromosome segregation ATPase